MVFKRLWLLNLLLASKLSDVAMYTPTHIQVTGEKSDEKSENVNFGTKDSLEIPFSWLINDYEWPEWLKWTADYNANFIASLVECKQASKSERAQKVIESCLIRSSLIDWLSFNL